MNSRFFQAFRNKMHIFVQCGRIEPTEPWLDTALRRDSPHQGHIESAEPRLDAALRRDSPHHGRIEPAGPWLDTALRRNSPCQKIRAFVGQSMKYDWRMTKSRFQSQMVQAWH